MTDSLTRINNRAYFAENYSKEFRRAIRQRTPLSIILCDIDHFKSVNDNHGHTMGDDCLRLIAAELKASVGRAGDILARYGGEEFILLLINTEQAAAINLANVIRQRIEALSFQVKNQSIPITASLGVASAIPSIHDKEIDLINQADEALYKAKIEGRNRVEQALI